MNKGKYVNDIEHDIEHNIDGKLVLDPKDLVVLVGNKCDMDRNASKEEAEKICFRK